MTDQRNISPADELGHLRAEMKRLKERETELKTEIAESGQTSGTDFEVRITEQNRRSFDRKLLPQEIQDDERYWKTTTTRVVRTVAVREPAEDALIDDDDA